MIARIIAGMLAKKALHQAHYLVDRDRENDAVCGRIQAAGGGDCLHDGGFLFFRNNNHDKILFLGAVNSKK